jgi:hypothetical protein
VRAGARGRGTRARTALAIAAFLASFSAPSPLRPTAPERRLAAALVRPPPSEVMEPLAEALILSTLSMAD